jgi:hypothetical protein
MKGQPRRRILYDLIQLDLTLTFKFSGWPISDAP